MKKKKFKAALQSGHKEAAVAVPFDPAETWGVVSEPLWRGRRGHRVQATLNGVSFASFIVPRQQKFFMMVDEAVKQQAGAAVGDIVAVTVTLARGLKA